MARKATDPDQEMAELRERRTKLAAQRHELDALVATRQRVVDDAPARRRAVLLAEARGEAPPEKIDAIELESRTAEAEIAGAREKGEALRVVEEEIAADMTASFDKHVDHYTAIAEAASEAASEEIFSAAKAASAAAASWRAASERWAEVRASRRRHGEDLPGVPISDFGNAVSELGRSYSRPYPGGSREAWERWCEEEGVATPRARPVHEPLLETR